MKPDEVFRQYQERVDTINEQAHNVKEEARTILQEQLKVLQETAHEELKAIRALAQKTKRSK